MPKEIINEDFEFPEEFKVGEENNNDYEIEVVDDTPDQDQGRKPLEGRSEEEHEEELENYSEKVQKRINQINHKFHDQRRVAEQAAREREEAVRFAQSVHEENQRLKETLSWGTQEYTKSEQAKIELAQKLAEDKYRKAYEAGDTEGTLSASKELSALAVQRDRVDSMFQQAATPNNNVSLQQRETPVYSPQTAPQTPVRTPDPKAEDWAARNPWFGKDEEMTSLAYGLHQKMVNSGIDPTSDEYYQNIDSGIRQRFPEKFERPKKASPVAPVGRTTASKKVTLTASQVAIAKRLGVPLEVYAKHAAKENNVNG
jgi:hypothetical protein